MGASQPAESVSHIAEAVSEFSLPTEVRELTTRILWELINPRRKSVALAFEARTQAVGKIDDARRKLEKALGESQAHLQGQRVLSGSIALHEQPDGSARENLDLGVAMKRLKEVESEVSALTADRPPRYIPRKNADRLSVSVGMLVFGGVSSWIMNGGIFVALLIALFVWFFVVLTMRQIWTKAATRRYRKILRLSQGLAAHLNTLKAVAECDHRSNLDKINAEFEAIAEQLRSRIASLYEQSGIAGAEWDSPLWRTWSPDTSPEFAARLGLLTIGSGANEAPHSEFAVSIPALVPFTDGRCLLFDASRESKATAANGMLSVILRVLASAPPGKARFTLIDPVGLGQNVADFMHLGDLNKELISGKAWSEPQHIEQQLALLTEHIEMVIQTCLRNEFTDIREYNHARREVSQAFRFLVVNDFPANFTESAARRLVSIVKNGPRCGVYTFIVRDEEKKLPYGFEMSDITQAATRIRLRDTPGSELRAGEFYWDEKDYSEFKLVLDAPPPQALTQRIVAKCGEMAIPAMKIDVPFARMLADASLTETTWWKGSAASGLKVPLGPAGTRSIQELVLGGEQEAHALLVGRTGSGKTNLMHVIITTIGLRYPASEVELYLIDFKGGVGFKRYAEYRLPHAKVIAIESEREFGISVLRGLDAELKRRADLFRSAGVDSLSAYRKKMQAENGDTTPIARVLLVADEFQEFFTENDDLAQQAKTIFERLARQGRSFGIHFLLATQSLSGSAQLPSSIMGQIKVRIALPCSETDSRLILADDNKAARALSFPGEAIYNPMGGLVEGNARFNVARFSDDELPQYLSAISDAARDGRIPLVFEGNELAQIAECPRIIEALAAPQWSPSTKGVDLLVGEPIAILPPVAASMRRQSGKNLMILAREESEGAGMSLAALMSIMVQQAPTAAQVYIADFTVADSEWSTYASEVARRFPMKVQVVNRQRDVTEMLATVAQNLTDRAEYVPGQPTVYLFILGLHRVKALRDDTEDENGRNPVDLLKSILRDGPEVGVHVVAWADTWGNATRGLDRKSMGEFGLRIATAMDSGDSMNFLDSLAASKLTKPHRALFYDEDKPGQLVVFRPYALPTLTWLSDVGQRLNNRTTNDAPPTQSPT